MDHFVYVAGSGNRGSLECFGFDLSSGTLTPLQRYDAEDPMFLAADLTGTSLYVANGPDSARAYSIAPQTGALLPRSIQPSFGGLAVHVSVHPRGHWLFISNYIGGNVSVFPIGPGGDIGRAVATEASGHESHQIVPDPAGKFVFVPCRGPNYVAVFEFNDQTGALTPHSPATVASDDPRHIAFHPNAKWAYLLNEDPATLVTYEYQAGSGHLKEVQKQRLSDAENWGSHILVSPNGKFVFAAGRHTHCVFVFSIDQDTGRLTPVTIANTSLSQPRGYAIDPTGKFLIVANENAASVVVMRIAENGFLTKVGDAIPSVTEARSVVIVPAAALGQIG